MKKNILNTGKVILIARWLFKTDNWAFMLRMGVMMLACASANAQATEVEASIFSNAAPWVAVGLRVAGGIFCIGGIFGAFKGVTGREDGAEKVGIVGIGIVAVALGGYMLKDPKGLVKSVGFNVLADKMTN